LNFILDDYITKIIADVKEKIAIERPKQFIKNWEEEFRNGLKRKGKIEEKNEKYEEIDKKLETLESSTSTAFAQEVYLEDLQNNKKNKFSA